MNTRSIGILAVVTAVTVTLGVMSSRQRTQASAVAARDQMLVPEFGPRINDVTQVQIESAEGLFTITNDGGKWGMLEKANYPVDQGKVRSLLFALKDAAVLEPKTSKEALYPKLGVEGLEVPDSPSIQVTVSAADGAKLAAVVVGKRGASQSRETYYVRRMEEAPSFLVEADLAIDKSDSAWLDKQIVDLARERVRAIEIQHTGGERVFAHKADEAATDFVLSDIPEGKELRYAGAPGSLATGLARLEMDDVRAAADVTLPEQSLAVATYWTFDGLKVSATLYELEEELLATFVAEYDAEGPDVNAFQGEGALADDAMAMPDGTEPAEETPVDADTSAQVQSEAQTLTAKTAAWVYVLPSWKKSNLAKTMEELTKDLPPPPAPQEPETLEQVEVIDSEPSDADSDAPEHDAGDGHEHAAGDDHEHGADDGHDHGDEDGH